MSITCLTFKPLSSLALYAALALPGAARSYRGVSSGFRPQLSLEW
jgi:hypothetical protein